MRGLLDHLEFKAAGKAAAAAMPIARPATAAAAAPAAPATAPLRRGAAVRGRRAAAAKLMGKKKKKKGAGHAPVERDPNAPSIADIVLAKKASMQLQADWGDDDDDDDDDDGDGDGDGAPELDEAAIEQQLFTGPLARQRLFNAYRHVSRERFTRPFGVHVDEDAAWLDEDHGIGAEDDAAAKAGAALRTFCRHLSQSAAAPKSRGADDATQGTGANSPAPRRRRRRLNRAGSGGARAAIAARGARAVGRPRLWTKAHRPTKSARAARPRTSTRAFGAHATSATSAAATRTTPRANSARAARAGTATTTAAATTTTTTCRPTFRRCRCCCARRSCAARSRTRPRARSSTCVRRDSAARTLPRSQPCCRSSRTWTSSTSPTTDSATRRARRSCGPRRRCRGSTCSTSRSTTSTRSRPRPCASCSATRAASYARSSCSAPTSTTRSARLCASLERNNSLTALDLAHNAIGSAELENFVKPELVTGGEAIGEMLPANVKLVTLDVSWNKIRKDSACALADGLAENASLRTLRLDYNTFEEIATQRLGEALHRNSTLRTLSLQYNNVTPKACLCLAAALQVNAGLTTLNLSGNTPGRGGVRALMKAMQDAQEPGRHVSILLRNCDVVQEDAKLFDPLHPKSDYELQLEDPYDRMQAVELLRLASTRDGCRFAKLRHNGVEINLEPTGPPDPAKIAHRAPHASRRWAWASSARTRGARRSGPARARARTEEEGQTGRFRVRVAQGARLGPARARTLAQTRPPTVTRELLGALLAWLGFQPDNRVLEQLQMKGTDRVRDADRGLLDEIARYLDEDDDFDEVEELHGARAGLSRNTPPPRLPSHEAYFCRRADARPHAPTPHDK